MIRQRYTSFSGFIKIASFLAFFLSTPLPARAENETIESLSLGEWAFPEKTADSAFFTLDTNGNLSNINKIIVKNAHPGKISLLTKSSHKIGTSSTKGKYGCEITFTPLLSETQTPANVTTIVFAGANVSVTSLASCIAGTYNNSFTITLGTLDPIIIPFTFTILKSAKLSLQEIESLNFGTIISTGTNGYTTINPQNGNITSSLQSTSRGKRGLFKFSGAPNTKYTISTPTDLNLTNNKNTAHLPVQLTTSANLNIGSDGTDKIYTGGTITVPANTPAGEYSATYILTVNY